MTRLMGRVRAWWRGDVAPDPRTIEDGDHDPTRLVTPAKMPIRRSRGNAPHAAHVATQAAVHGGA